MAARRQPSVELARLAVIIGAGGVLITGTMLVLGPPGSHATALSVATTPDDADAQSTDDPEDIAAKRATDLLTTVGALAYYSVLLDDTPHDQQLICAGWHQDPVQVETWAVESTHGKMLQSEARNGLEAFCDDPAHPIPPPS